MDTIQLDLTSLQGTWRRFGPSGPIYEIIGVGKAKENGDRTMHIRVLESGEEIDYLLAHLLNDPHEI